MHRTGIAMLLIFTFVLLPVFDVVVALVDIVVQDEVDIDYISHIVHQKPNLRQIRFNDERKNKHTGIVVDETVRGNTGRELQTAAQIQDLLLINADTDVVISSLVDGMIIDVRTAGTSNFSIQAIATAGTIGSVRFGYNTTTNFRTESEAPYALCGNQGTNYYSCPILTQLGWHRITATPFTGTRATGTMGSTKAVSFQIVRSSPTMAPAAAVAPTLLPIIEPMKSPTSAPTSKPTKAPSLSNGTDSPTSKAPTATSSPTSKAPTATSSPVSKSPTKQPLPPATCNIPKFNSSWEVLPNYPYTLSETQAELIGTNIVITGGFINSFASTTKHTYTRSINNFNTDTWRQMDDMPAPIGITHAATLVIGSKMYMCGGYEGQPPGPHVSNCYIYDHSMPPGSGLQWSDFVPLPNNGTAGAAMLYDAHSNTIYYTGGAQRPILGRRQADDKFNTWKISLDNITAGWRNSTPIPYGANHQSYVTVNYLQREERHYVLGGQNGENEASGNVADVFEFHSNMETWSRKADMLSPRGHATVSTRPIGECGFIIAGGAINGAQLTRTNEIHYYHIPNNTWTLMGTLPQSIATPPVFVGQDDYMYFISNQRTRRRKIVF